MNITIFLFIIITFFIIIQFILLFNFLFKYIYNFQYYNNYRKICKNNFIEYETNRFNFYKEYYSFYLGNNKFNKINNYLVLSIVSIFSIVFSIIISYYIFNIINDINKFFYNNTVLKIFINIIFYSIILHILSYIPYLLGINFDNNIILSENIINKVNSNLHYYIFGLYTISILILFNYKTSFSLQFFIILLIIFEFIKFHVSYNIKILKLRNNIKYEKVYDNYDIKLVEKASIAKNMYDIAFQTEQTAAAAALSSPSDAATAAAVVTAADLSYLETNHSEIDLRQKLGRSFQKESQISDTLLNHPDNDIRSNYNNIFIDYFINIFGIDYYYKYNDIYIDNYLLKDNQEDDNDVSSSPNKNVNYYISTLYKNIKQDKINFNIFIIEILLIIFVILLFINNITNLKFNEYLSFVKCFKFDIDCKYLIFNFNESKKISNFFILPFIVLFILLVIIESTYRYNDIINQYIIEQPNLLYKNDILHLRHDFDNIYNKIENINSGTSVYKSILDNNITNSIYLTLYNNIFSNFLSKNDIDLLLGFRWKKFNTIDLDTHTPIPQSPVGDSHHQLAVYLQNNIDDYRNKEIEFTYADYFSTTLKINTLSNLTKKHYLISPTGHSDGKFYYYKPIHNHSEKYYYMNFIPEFKNNNSDLSSQEYDIKYYINSKCDNKNIFYSSYGNSKDNINYDLIIYILNDILFNNFDTENDFKNYIKILIYKSFKNIDNNKNYLGNYKLSNDNSKNNNLYFIHKINNFYYKNSKIQADGKSSYEYSKILIDSDLTILKYIKTRYNSDNNIVKYIDTIIDFDKSKSSYEEIMDTLYKIKKKLESKASYAQRDDHIAKINDLIIIFKIDITKIDIKYNNDQSINQNIIIKINSIISHYYDFRYHIRYNLVQKIPSLRLTGLKNINEIYKLLLEINKDELNTLISIIIDNLITLFNNVKIVLNDLNEDDYAVPEDMNNMIRENINSNYDFYNQIENNIQINEYEDTNPINNYNENYDLRNVNNEINKYINLRQKNSQYTFLLLLIIYILSYFILIKIKL